MRPRPSLGILVCAALALIGAGPVPQPPAAGMAEISAAVSARLEDLKPEDPAGYFKLAEELADTAAEETEKVLPRTLYVLAFELDRKRSDTPGLAASCALGLARIERLERDRRWLTALAGAIDRRYSLPD